MLLDGLGSRVDVLVETQSAVNKKALQAFLCAVQELGMTESFLLYLASS